MRTQTVWVWALCVVLLGVLACGDDDATGSGLGGGEVEADAGDSDDAGGSGGSDAASDQDAASADGGVDASGEGADGGEVDAVGADDTSVDAAGDGGGGGEDAAQDGSGDAEGDALEDADSDADEADAPDAPPEACPPGWSGTVVDRGELEPQRTRQDTLARCASQRYWGVTAAGSTWGLSFSGLPVGTLVQVRQGPESAPELASLFVGEPNQPQSLSWTATHSGEVRVTVQRTDGLDEGAFSITWVCQGGCDLETTRYPVVLVHGAAGTDTYLNLLDYFYGVKDDLRALGYRVYTPATLFIGHSRDRAALLLAFIEEVLADQGARKVHLIGHSQGGLDLRVLVSPGGLDAQDVVASMTSVATPHGGINADLLGLLPGQDFSSSYMLGGFLDEFPELEEGVIPTFSWGAKTCRLLDFACVDETGGEVVTPFLRASYDIVRLAHRDDAWDGANDGVVPLGSMPWGTFLGVLPADHFDEVGQIADQREGPFDHIGFYRSEVRRLRALEIDEGL